LELSTAPVEDEATVNIRILEEIEEEAQEEETEEEAHEEETKEAAQEEKEVSASLYENSAAHLSG
jgi:hypothetical protein